MITGQRPFEQALGKDSTVLWYVFQSAFLIENVLNAELKTTNSILMDLLQKKHYRDVPSQSEGSGSGRFVHFSANRNRQF